MQKETHLVNRKNKILILFLFLGLILIFLLYLNNNIHCIFKKIFKIPCPACGMTRAFIQILNFNIINSFSYNILAFPLCVTLTTILTLDVIDIIFKKNYVNKIIKTISKNYYIIIILLILSFIINIYRSI